MPPEMPHESHSFSKLFLLLIILVVVGLGLFALTPRAHAPEPEATVLSQADLIRRGEAPIPAYSTSTAQKLAASTGFQALFSYTDGGFEPREVRIRAGETVRFTNNSSGDLWVARDPSALYPQRGELCDGENLDTCGPLAPQDFFEFTFAQRGTWGVMNNLEKEKRGIVRVE